MKAYTTLTEAINDLIQQGYISNFNIKSYCIECPSNHLKLKPNEFEVDIVYRFQEMSDVDNESILYAISSIKNNAKGLLVNAYGIYADTDSAELIAKLGKPLS
ncbi:phosphoribosylpyrophosphate synthetase [Winogradskyella sp. MIT101101]|uniref:phosphoribosylpyrophosphate synthetase n=1 Tax=Winogradskyella sp. MIT101101 TaxID=3098297 RepID=UPI00399B9C52